ncbi:MAG TPA: ATP-binding cassette domain-containing protein, partial [Burkholderiales bacterium]|nr:ATP-binding cassette domain-containing protein [Burkholderiales bacterium]
MLAKAHFSPAGEIMALRFAQVTKHYANIRALAEFSLEVQPGEFFGVIGVNGAGKTTLLKSLLDFCGIDGGSIEIFGVSHRLTRARARLAFLPERFT